MGEPWRILAVDDEGDILRLITYHLEKEGFSVEAATDGESGLLKARQQTPDLMILDLMLPGIQGMEICRRLKSDPVTGHLPIIMLTAKSDELDRVLGLEIGADDYITKPFSPKELVARIRAVLRRTAEPKKEHEPLIRVGDLVMNLETYSVTRRNDPLDLSATEFRLLRFLVERRGKVFSRDQLLSAVWKDEGYVEPRTVDVHIRRLRAQIEDDPANPRYIKTRRGIGYYVKDGGAVAENDGV